MAKYREWCDGLERDLAEPFAPEDHRQKKQGGSTIPFVNWSVYVSRLNELVGGGWEMGEPIIREVSGKLIVGVPITILGVTRVNFGDEAEDKDSFGSAITNSYAQALKRTCALFGLGLYMYDEAERTEAMKPRAAKPAMNEQLVEIATELDTRAVPDDVRERITARLNGEGKGFTERSAGDALVFLRTKFELRPGAAEPDDGQADAFGQQEQPQRRRSPQEAGR